MDTEPYPVVAGLLILKTITCQITYPEYGARAMDTEYGTFKQCCRLNTWM